MVKKYEPTIAIVGGVAGGASAATRARRMNEQARIILFEKDDHVSFANCGRKGTARTGSTSAAASVSTITKDRLRRTVTMRR